MMRTQIKDFEPTYETEREQAIEELFKTLSPIMKRAFLWLALHEQGFSYRLIGEMNNLSTERIRQRIEECLRVCRHPTRIKIIKDFYQGRSNVFYSEAELKDRKIEMNDTEIYKHFIDMDNKYRESQFKKHGIRRMTEDEEYEYNYNHAPTASMKQHRLRREREADYREWAEQKQRELSREREAIASRMQGWLI